MDFTVLFLATKLPVLIIVKSPYINGYMRPEVISMQDDVRMTSLGHGVYSSGCTYGVRAGYT